MCLVGEYNVSSLSLSLSSSLSSAFQRPLLDIDLSQDSPDLSIMGVPQPIFSKFVQFVTPSHILPSAVSYTISGDPRCESCCPSVIGHSCNMSSPLPFKFSDGSYDISDSCFISDTLWCLMISPFDAEHESLMCLLHGSQFEGQSLGQVSRFSFISDYREYALIAYPSFQD